MENSEHEISPNWKYMITSCWDNHKTQDHVWSNTAAQIQLRFNHRNKCWTRILFSGSCSKVYFPVRCERGRCFLDGTGHMNPYFNDSIHKRESCEQKPKLVFLMHNWETFIYFSYEIAPYRPSFHNSFPPFTFSTRPLRDYWTQPKRTQYFSH